MKKEEEEEEEKAEKEDTFGFFIVVGIWIICFLLVANYEWLPEWLGVQLPAWSMFSSFIIYAWYSWYKSCKRGVFRTRGGDFTKEDNPFWFLFAKYLFLIVCILITIGLCYLFIFREIQVPMRH